MDGHQVRALKVNFLVKWNSLGKEKNNSLCKNRFNFKLKWNEVNSRVKIEYFRFI